MKQSCLCTADACYKGARNVRSLYAIRFLYMLLFLTVFLFLHNFADFSAVKKIKSSSSRWWRFVTATSAQTMPEALFRPTPNKPGRFTFPVVFRRSHPMQNDMAFHEA